MAALPASLDALYDPSYPERQRYDCVRISNAHEILQLPLAARLFGHFESEDVSRLRDGTITYAAFIAANIDASLRDSSLNATVSRSQILHIGLAALNAFLQSNVTGPPLEFSSSNVIIPSPLRENATSLRLFREQLVRSLTVDGEAAYKLTPNVELFCAAKALLTHRGLFLEVSSPLVAYTSRLRVNFLHQKLLSEVTGTLQTAIYEDLDVLQKALSTSSEKDTSLPSEDLARFLSERSTIHIHHGFDAKARADLEQAASATGFQFALTGRLGKRTKFQDRDISQLVVLAKSADDKEDEEKTDDKGDNVASGPKNLDLNDDTLLEAISFKKEVRTEEKSMTVQDDSSLPPALATLDPSDQPKLNPIDSIILLSLASAITNTSPENGLTREETAPYAARVLEGGSSNWQVYSQALLVRSRIEGYRTRTVERSVLQLQALVDQVMADTTPQPTSDNETSPEVTTFLPRPKASESAPASERLEYIWLLGFSTRWDLEGELASRWVSLGGFRSALEIYERLQMWAEAALCYAATDREDKAKLVIRKQLYNRTNPASTGENDTFEGPELDPLPANAPRLFCILGDIDTDPAMYERAWAVSGNRYARAQRSLARHYLSIKPPMFEKAEEAYRTSLNINRLNHPAWFALGCVQLELEKWEEAIESFTRTIQLEDTDAEAWSNLAVALINLPPSKSNESQKVIQPAPDEDEEEEPANKSEVPDPYKNKKDALVALQRAARLKHSDHRIWDNVLTVSASIPPPHTPFRDIIQAQRHIIELLGPKKGEKCIDITILTVLIDTLTTQYNYDEITTPQQPNSSAPSSIRRGSLPYEILKLLEQDVTPLITHSAPLWLLIAKVEKWRNRPSRALLAHEKAWRATLASCTGGAFQSGDEKKWMRIVTATERLVKEGYAILGPMDKERDDGGAGETGTGDGEELVAKDWRFKARSAVNGILGKGKDFWEDTEGWNRLKELSAEAGGRNY